MNFAWLCVKTCRMGRTAIGFVGRLHMVRYPPAPSLDRPLSRQGRPSCACANAPTLPFQGVAITGYR
jgi:hypothetical protein